MRVRALHDLVTVAPDELAFHAGDILTVLDEHVPQDANVWVRAEKNGMVGLIPMNYFKVIPTSSAEVASRNPSIHRQPSGYNGSPEGETEDSDSPSSSLLHDVLITRQNSTRSRRGRESTHGGGKATSSPEIQMYYYEGMEEPWAESTSSLGFDLDGEDYDYPVTKGEGSLPPSDLSLTQQEMDRKERESKAQTAPPSPSRYPMPAPSPRQIPSTLAPKKPPPPPPPPRRSQSSTQVGTLMSSTVGLQGGSAAEDNAPPTLPPPYRRPPIPGRAATRREDHGHGVSPFGS
jgi:hypothetical protein